MTMSRNMILALLSITFLGTGVSLNNLFLLLEPVFILTMAVKQILMCFTSFSFRNSLPSY